MITFILIIAMVMFLGCVTTTEETTGSLDEFTREMDVSTVAPTRLYSWIQSDYANKAAADIQNKLLVFHYDTNGDYLVRVEGAGKKTVTTWGNQLRLQDRTMRTEIFTAFILGAYALQDNKDPLDITFEALKQIMDEKIYSEREERLIEAIREGIREYRIGGTSWKNYKKETFEIRNKMIRIQ